jgi:hypothetical protein
VRREVERRGLGKCGACVRRALTPTQTSPRGATSVQLTLRPVPIDGGGRSSDAPLDRLVPASEKRRALINRRDEVSLALPRGRRRALVIPTA